MLGAAGLSLSLASGASAATSGPAADMPTQNTGVSHEIILGEEEVSDVSLATSMSSTRKRRNTPTRRAACQRRLRRLRQRMRRLQRLRRLQGLRRL